ncbi:MAG: hypothetical protein AB1492_06335 [Bacillota bacterium]
MFNFTEVLGLDPPRVIAHCFAGNKPAIALGKSLGFVITRTLYFTETVFP